MQFRHIAWLTTLCAVVVGCSRSQPVQPRTLDEIFAEQMELPAVYLTAGGKRIEAPSGRGPFVDAETGEIAWMALACLRPDCPGKKSDGEPVLFIAPDSAMYVAADGKIATDPSRATEEPPHAMQCPVCWKQRNLSAETSAQKQQFNNWVAPYVLPETTARLAELEQERKLRVRRDQHRALADQ